MSRRISVAHLVSHPIPYFAPLYRELARRPEIDLTVYFYSDASVRDFRDREFGRTVRWDGDLLGGYRWRMLPSARRTGIGEAAHRRPNWDVVRDVMRGGYGVLWVHGHQHLTTWLAVAAARLRGMRVLVRDEQTLLHPRPFPRSLVRGLALRALYSQSSALYIGEANRRHFSRYGMPARRMFAAPYCVDNQRYVAAARALAAERAEVRGSFGIAGDRPVVLFAGKLIPKKQPLLLLEAFARVRRDHDCALLFAGDGPLRGDAERLARRLGTPDVHFAGFLNESEMPRAYAAADVFVLPSNLHETWGLVVNEAMNFGLPVVVSDKVGCAADLVRPGENGYVVRHDDAGALAGAVARLVADAGLRAQFGERSRAIVREYSIERCADGIVAACTGATERGERWSTRRAIAA
ncbi:MAG TPA: glycosyltransferase family 4 protein [Candidatus Tectomicrobia bacterium]|nr:glycosyltransferase family 4 protein [Candidatus Tectomicrobia bacterium]